MSVCQLLIINYHRNPRMLETQFSWNLEKTVTMIIKDSNHMRGAFFLIYKPIQPTDYKAGNYLQVIAIRTLPLL